MNRIQPDTLEGQYAGFISRLAAFAIDVVIVNLAVLAVSGLTVLLFNFFTDAFALMPRFDGTAFERFTAITVGVVAVGTFVVMLFLYPTLFWMIGGQTLGKRVMGLRVVRMDGSRMTVGRGLLRVFGYLLSAVPLFLGFIWVIINNERRGWHDLLANTCVVYSWKAQDSAALRLLIQRTQQQLTGATDKT